MFKQVFVTVIACIMTCTTIHAAPPLFSTDTSSQFTSQAESAHAQIQDRYQQELNQKLAQIPKFGSNQSQTPATAPTSAPSESSDQSNLYWTPENNPKPNMQQQYAAPAPSMPSAPAAATPPATTPLQPYQAAPTTQQSQTYTGFQSPEQQGGGTMAPRGQQPRQQTPKAPAGGGWNIKY